MNIFGKKEEELNYKVRTGAYAIILNSEKEVALIRANGQQYFLPGGGLENGETHEQCLKREMYEESGYELIIKTFIGRAKRYFISTLPVNEPIESDAYFYSCELGNKKKEPSDKDAFLEWVKIDDAIKMLYHEHQSWGIKEIEKSLNDEGEKEEYA